MQRTDEQDRDSRWVPIASLRGFRARDSAAIPQPKGPPARSGEAAGCLCVKRAHPHSRTQIFGKKRRRNLRAGSRKRVRQHGTNDRFGWFSAGQLLDGNGQNRAFVSRLNLAESGLTALG